MKYLLITFTTLLLSGCFGGERVQGTQVPQKCVAQHAAVIAATDPMERMQAQNLFTACLRS